MKHILILFVLFLVSCSPAKLDPEKEALFKEFNKDKVLVATCSAPEGYATAEPQTVFRFRGDLVVVSIRRDEIIKIEATPENVCSKLRSSEPQKKSESEPEPVKLANMTIGALWEWVAQIWKTISRK